MKRIALIAASAALLALPAVAQQKESPLGQTLQNLGRSLQGQGGDEERGVDRSDRGARDDAYQRAYRDNQRSFRDMSDDELRRTDRQISKAWVELQAASRALDDETKTRDRGGVGTSGSGSSRDERRYDDRDRSRR